MKTPVTPDEILLEEYLHPMRISQNIMARASGVQPRTATEIVLCKRATTGCFLKSRASKSLSIVSSIGGNPTAETAMSIHPHLIEKDGRKEFVVLPYEEFLQMQEEIENYEDLRTLREEKAAARAEPTRSLDEELREIGN